MSAILDHYSGNKLEIEPKLKRQVLAFCQPDGRIFSLWLGWHAAVWAAGVAGVVALEGHPWWQLLIAIALGSQIHTFTVLQHECGHQSAYVSKAANRWVGRFLAWFIYMPFTTFTELHRFHHGFLGDKRLDPDEWHYEGGLRRMFLREMLFMPRFIYLSLTEPHIKPEVKRQVWIELAVNTLTFLALIAGLLIIGRPDVLLFGFLIPMLLLGVVYNPISRGYEHYPMACLAPDDPRRGDLRHNTVTVTSRLFGFLWANITFHVEHHLFPRAPFYRLPRIHRLLADHSYRKSKYPLADLHKRLS